MGPSRTTSTVVTLVASAVVLALGACTEESPPSPTGASTTATTSAPATTPASPSPTPSPAGTASASTSAPAGYSLDEAASPTFPELGGDLGGVGQVRVGRHPTYDRVVWQFPGSGPPTYRVRYVDQPTADGSGDVVQVAGDSYLEVMVTSVTIPPDGTSRPPNAPPASLAGTGIASATSIYGGFEGYGQAFVGVRGERRPFTVSVLTNPTRLVLDVRSG